MPPRVPRISFLALAALLLAALLLPAPGASLASTSTAPASAELAAVKLTGRALPSPKRRATPKPVKPRAATAAPAPAELLPNDPLWSASWSLVRSGATRAWATTTGAPEVVVAVLDTGIDAAHPDLAGALVPGWDAVGEDADASDDHGHGTAVAGVIGARSNNGVGVAGVCGRCSLMPVKVIGGDGSGSAADIAEGIAWAVDHGAAVLNLSFVLSGYDGAVAAAIDYARARGALVVAAAGNAGGGEPTFPASHPGVLGVTATDGADVRYDWATHGSWVTVAAPGCTHSTTLGGGYGDVCGTSSSTAFASGAAALVRAAAPGVAAERVAEALTSSAVRVGDFVASGRLDVAAAVQRARSGAAQPAPSAPAPVTPGAPDAE